MPGDFDGWDEIARYLKMDRRNAQRCERERGLPVHRLPGRKRSTVYAFREELDAWLREPQKVGTEDLEPSEKSLLQDRRFQVAGAVSLLALTILVILYSAGVLFPAQPSSAAVVRNNWLAAYDEAGRTLWEKHFEGLVSQSLRSGIPVRVADLDADGRKEILVGISGESVPRNRLLCLDGAGEVEWEYSVGSRLAWGGAEIPDKFLLYDYSLAASPGGDGKTVVVIANHAYDSPSCVAVLDSEGRVIGEYWHTGWIFDHVVAEPDEDGEDSIVICGVNDFHGRAFVAAIRPDTPRAISPVPDGYAPQFARGRELHYALFPTTEVGVAVARTSRAYEIRRAPEGQFVVGLQLPVTGGVDRFERVYHLDRDLRPLHVVFAQEYESLHYELREKGRLPRESEPDREAAMRMQRLTGQ